MIANYHTHTARCGHAFGTEREYIEKAIAGGLKILGFSDHTPQLYPNGYVSPDKMLPSQLEDYVDTVLRLKDEYKNDITIHLGLEVEYYPMMWEALLRFLEPYPIEYMLLGQHYVDNEIDNPPYSGRRTDSLERLHAYCTQCMEALETGRFLYSAHPDLLNYAGSDELYVKEMGALCRFCRERGIPLELNLLGLRDHRRYPRDLFWEVAAEEGNAVVLGSDAHTPGDVYSDQDLADAYALLDRCGLPGDRVLTELEDRF